MRHKCDVKRCVNPKHLELGTHSDNIVDSYKRSDRLGGFKPQIPDETVLEIYTADGSGVQIAERFGITPTHVSDIKRGLKRARVTKARIYSE